MNRAIKADNGFKMGMEEVNAFLFPNYSKEAAAWEGMFARLTDIMNKAMDELAKKQAYS